MAGFTSSFGHLAQSIIDFFNGILNLILHFVHLIVSTIQHLVSTVVSFVASLSSFVLSNIVLIVVAGVGFVLYQQYQTKQGAGGKIRKKIN